MSERGKIGSLTEALCDDKLSAEIKRLSSRQGGLPTPTAMDCKASGVAGNWTRESSRNAGATLTDVVVRKLDQSGSTAEGQSTGTGGMRLSPAFVEWMMGLPPGWTRIPTPSNSTSSETASSLKRQPRRGNTLPGACSQVSLNLKGVTQDAFPVDFRKAK